jgi:NAD(P)H-hydrate epimerase
VLTGVVGAFLAALGDPLAAARLGVWVHATAGDLAAAEVGETALLAGDLLDFLPAVLRDLEGAEPAAPEPTAAEPEEPARRAS